jgi:hypothetical protein
LQERNPYVTKTPEIAESRRKRVKLAVAQTVTLFLLGAISGV